MDLAELLFFFRVFPFAIGRLCGTSFAHFPQPAAGLACLKTES